MVGGTSHGLREQPAVQVQEKMVRKRKEGPSEGQNNVLRSLGLPLM